ncbi:MAG: hypothetical protein LBC20_06440 [Planctomycetaceae bacterium]|nr:hypothetical protein [Planctomycetaceae bacterium]
MKKQAIFQRNFYFFRVHGQSATYFLCPKWAIRNSPPQCGGYEVCMLLNIATFIDLVL